MKNNQYSIVHTSHEKIIEELKDTHWLSIAYHRDSFSEVLRHFLVQCFPVLRNDFSSINQMVDQLLISKTQRVADLTGDNITQEQFYLIALQLLHFDFPEDYSLDDPMEAYKRMQLPFNDHATFGVDELIDAWYLLLLTRNKNGATLFDDLYGQGRSEYFREEDERFQRHYFNGKSLPIFDTSKLIREVVYVETSVDTDSDGKADLVKVEIMRPQENDRFPITPAVLTASPYNQGTNDAWGLQQTHDVNQPLKHKTMVEDHTKLTDFDSKFAPYRDLEEALKPYQTFTKDNSYSLNDYLAARGFAIVYAAGIGTKDSDGFQTCGSPEQTAATTAVIEWLAGNPKRRAFQSRDASGECLADWCNGSVAMTGRSYLGTLATAAATSGVEGLKTIIPEAGITSWYDYYRENGLVMAPGGFQGEDADVLAAETFSRKLTTSDYVTVQKSFNKYLKQMQTDMDRGTGNYNNFWRARNYRPDFDKITADVLIIHGLNDWNVKPNQAKTLYDHLQSKSNSTKIILHQGQHININAFRSFDYSEIINLWLTNKLYGVDNHVDEILPNVIVQANNQVETWDNYDSWEEVDEKTFHLADSKLTEIGSATQELKSYQDELPKELFDQYTQHPQNWQKDLLQDKHNNHLTFKTSPLQQETLLRGTPQVSATIASSVDHGLLSAQLVDFGTDKRLNVSPTILERNGIQLGYKWREDDLREFQMETKPSDYKVISYGHINLQNRQNARQVDDLSANEFVQVTFDLQPIFHHLNADHQLGLILFGTDFAMTLRGNEQIKYTIDLSQSSITIPTVQTLG